MTTDESPSAIAAGDAVKVFDVNGARAQQPAGGWDGTIAKIGRDFVYITYLGYRGGQQPQVFRKDTQGTKDGRGQRSYRTLAQATLRDQRHDALVVLRAHGLAPISGHELPLTTLEAVADTLLWLAANEE